MLQTFLTQRIPPQVGITILLVLSFLFLTFLFWNLQATQNEVFSLEVSPIFSLRKRQIFGFGRPLKEVIKISVEEKFASFEEKTLWLEEDFSKILAEKEKFKEAKINNFQKNISQLSQGKVNVSNLKVDFDEKEKAVVLNCILKGLKTLEGFYDFEWFLKNFPFDFSQFQKLENKLSFAGEVEETKVEIEIIFPFPIEVFGNKISPKE